MTRIVSKVTSRDAVWPFDKPEEKQKTETGKRYFRHINGKPVEVVPSREPREPVAPMIRMDSMPGDYHPVTGEWCDSRSKFRAINKATGTEERGMGRETDNVPVMSGIDDKDYERDVQIAREQLIAGTAPLTEFDRAVCKKIDEQLANKV